MERNKSIFKKFTATTATIINIYIAIIGFLLCQNIIVPLKIGSTPFNIILFLIPILILLLFFRNKKNIFSYFRKMPISYYLFLVSILISFVPGLIIAPRIGGILPAIKGLLFYIINSILPIVLALFLTKEDLKHLFFGLLVGYIANMLLSIIVYVAFNAFGYVLTLSKLFINDSFFVPNYFSSAQGLFLEPSHLAGFMFVVYYALLWYYRDKTKRILLTIITWIVFLMYGMGNLPIFILSQIVLFIYLYSKKGWAFIKNKVFVSKFKTALFVMALLIVIGGIVFLIIGPLKNKILSVLNEMNPFGNANKERMNTIVVGLNVFLSHPFGVGYNLSGMYLKTYYSEVLTTPTIFSYLIKIIVELGIFGLGSFIAFCFILIKQSSTKIKDSFLIILSFVLGIVFAFLSGPNEPYLYLAIGIVISHCGFKTNIVKTINRIKNKILSTKYCEIDI